MLTTTLGYPRIGPARELKRALESHWAGRTDAAELLALARRLRRDAWNAQRENGIDRVAVGDFSLYDHVLDTSFMFGVIPERFGRERTLETYFRMARGTAADGRAVQPLEMTKWFDTNYHYLVPEIGRSTQFSYAPGEALRQWQEAKQLEVAARPMLVGPLTFLHASKDPDDRARPLERLDALLEAYAEALEDLARAGADWVQLDEPCLVLELDPETRSAFRRAYERLCASPLRVLLATYFGGLGDNLELAASLPVSGIHLDALAAESEVEALAKKLGPTRVLSLGVVDGRNVWRADLSRALGILDRARHHLPEDRCWLAPTCSLLHVPLDVSLERQLDPELASWLAFARQKLVELGLLRRAALMGQNESTRELALAEASKNQRRLSPRVVDAAVRERLELVTPAQGDRRVPAGERRAVQRAALDLPLLPTTTIGSFPQTPELRKLRAAFRAGELDAERYEAAIRRSIDDTIRVQERIGLDVLVHGEAERNDMVEFFGEMLNGVAVTQHGWVQSYGSRCVKPPIIFGDVSRPRAMTVEFARYAQSLTPKPVKGMLTGPVTIAKWSFVRDDEPLQHTCRTLALALRDEVMDLEAAGIRIIQVDEPAFREALPLRKQDQGTYLAWAVDCFRLATAGVRTETQIHSHMCYAEFGDIIDAIAALDADVISIESARSAMELVAAFLRNGYPKDIGLGIYDIHSPRVPEASEMKHLLEAALGVLDPEQVWVNPDCGLKTRRWEEVIPALETMVRVASEARGRIGPAAG